MTTIDTWQHQGRQLRLAGDHDQLVSWYEQRLAEGGFDRVEDYWQLGLAYLLQNRDDEATSTWLSVMAEAEAAEVDRLQQSLIETLHRAAQDEIRRGSVADSLAIRQAIHELNPRLSVNQYLMTLTNLALSLGYFAKPFLEDSCLREVLLRNVDVSLKMAHADLIMTVHRFLWVYGASHGYKLLRRTVAAHYLVGRGIEIGALHNPMDVPADVIVQYVDRLPVSDLRRHYPELADFDLVDADILDDGETLGSIPDQALDFVIASHMIEHCQDPISTLNAFLRVLQPGGIILLVIPDKQHTFDRDRPVTSLEHLVKDYTEGPDWSRQAHYEEWCGMDKQLSQVEVTRLAQTLMEKQDSIHFHVWRPMAFAEFLNYCQTTLALPFEVELIQQNSAEFIVVLSKCDDRATPSLDVS